MSKGKRSKISVQGAAISILHGGVAVFISLTDMAQHFGDDSLIYNWMRNRNTVEYLGIWEQIHNPNFKGLEFETFKTEAGLNSFSLTPRKWIEATGAIGIQSRAGRHGGGTFAHPDIAFEFGAWLSPEFKLYLIKEFQRLKDDEAQRGSLGWNLNRTLSKLNYRIHTDAIKEHIIPATISKKQESYVYASEADVLNVALYGVTAKEWRDQNPMRDGNMRDYSSVLQLLVLVNLEGLNAKLIREELPQRERLKILNREAILQLKSLGALNLSRLDQPRVLPLDPEDQE